MQVIKKIFCCPADVKDVFVLLFKKVYDQLIKIKELQKNNIKRCSILVDIFVYLLVSLLNTVKLGAYIMLYWGFFLQTQRMVL